MHGHDIYGPRVALVTGASRGLGATVAGVLARRGFDLVLSARAGGVELDGVVEDVRNAGRSVRVELGDLAEESTRDALVTAVSSLGSLDLLFNNASELGGGLATLVDVPIERLDRVWRVNVVAPLLLVRGVLPWLSARQGLIVNVSSDAALGGYAGWGVYGASKAALEIVSRTLAGELEARGISVVTVDPGDMRTRMHQEAFPGEDISDRPLPTVTVPFWEWLLDQPAASISGERFQAQTEDERWAVRA